MKLKKILYWSIAVFLVALINLQFNFIKTESVQGISIIVSAVLIGFSFSVLSSLLNTSNLKKSIILEEVNRITFSIFFFFLSLLFSFLLALEIVSFELLYTVGMGYFFVGLFYFLSAVGGLYHLVNRVYSHNRAESERIQKMKRQMENQKRKLEKGVNYE